MGSPAAAVPHASRQAASMVMFLWAPGQSPPATMVELRESATASQTRRDMSIRGCVRNDLHMNGLLK